MESLLYDAPREGINVVAQEINGVLESRTAKEAKMIVEIVKATKRSFDAYM